MAAKVVKASMGLGQDKHDYSTRVQQDDQPHPHPQLEDLVNTVGLSLVQEFVQYLKGPEGEEALETILSQQAIVVSKLATTQEAKKAARVTASEAVCGSYDAVQRKWGEALSSGSMKLLAGVAVLYVMLVGVGVLLTLWRFAFFGLH